MEIDFVLLTSLTCAVELETPLEKSAAKKPKAPPAIPPTKSEITTTAEIGVFLRFLFLSQDGTVKELESSPILYISTLSARNALCLCF